MGLVGLLWVCLLRLTLLSLGGVVVVDVFLSEKTEFLPLRVQLVMHKLVQIFDSNIAPTATVFYHCLGFWYG